MATPPVAGTLGKSGPRSALALRLRSRDERAMPVLPVPPVLPDPADARLSTSVTGRDENGRAVETRVVTERALTIYLDDREIVSAMTIGDHPALMAVGYLCNQAMIRSADEIAGVDVDDDEGVVVVRTHARVDVSDKMRRRLRTSGCAQGTVFADVMADFERIVLPRGRTVRHSELIELSKRINAVPSLYLEAGAIHGAALACGSEILAFFEDVGRHNAVDKIAGWMLLNDVSPDDKTFYTTGRLTSEMVIKTVMMGLPVLASRSGFTAWGVDLARRSGLTLIGRMKGRRMVVLSGDERIEFDRAEIAETAA